MSNIVLPGGKGGLCGRGSVRPSRKLRRFRGAITFLVSVSPNTTHTLYQNMFPSKPRTACFVSISRTTCSVPLHNHLEHRLPHFI